jgi:hypothetical protein
MKFEGKILKGEIESANTHVGRDFKGLIEQGSSVAFSLRAVGPITENKKSYVEVKSPLSILCYDWIIHPSHSIAYMEKVLTESTMNMLLGKDQFTSDQERLSSGILSEGVSLFESGSLVPIYEAEMKNYIISESKNIRNIVNNFEINPNNSYISEDGNSLNIINGKDIIQVYLEDYLTDEIDSYLLKKF